MNFELLCHLANTVQFTEKDFQKISEYSRRSECSYAAAALILNEWGEINLLDYHTEGIDV